jgi:hypothetical protein
MSFTPQDRCAFFPFTLLNISDFVQTEFRSLDYYFVRVEDLQKYEIMAASPSPEGENASISDESDGGGGKGGENNGNVVVEERRPEGRNIGENYETTADIDLQLLEELGMIIDLEFFVWRICDGNCYVCWVDVVEGQ